MQSQDKLLNIEIASKPQGYFFHPADWSITNMPASPADAAALVAAYRAMQSPKHLALVMARGKDTDSLLAAANLKSLVADGLFELSDTVCLTYEGTIKRNGARLTTVAEPGWLFYRGQVPNFEKTQWFNKDFANASNHWDVTKHSMIDKCATTEPIHKTKWGLFSWEIGLLMCGLAHPWSTRSFIYEGNPNDSSLLSFIKNFGMKCYCYCNNESEAREAIRQYESESWKS